MLASELEALVCHLLVSVAEEIMQFELWEKELVSCVRDADADSFHHEFLALLHYCYE